MITPELTQYIKNARDAHTPEEVIRGNLKTSGWSDNDIDESLTGDTLPRASKKFPLLLVVIIPTLFVLVGGIFLLVSTFLIRENKDTKDSTLINSTEHPPGSDSKNISSTEWKQFENQQLQFTFNYPASWTIFDPHKLGIGGTITAFGTSAEAYGSWARPIPENESFITVRASPGTIDEKMKLNGQLEKAFRDHNAKETDPRKQYDYRIISKEQLGISGKKVSRVEWSILKGALVRTDESNGHFVTYYFQNTDFIYTFFLWTSEPLTRINREHIKLFDQMAQTVMYKLATGEELTGVKSASNSGGTVKLPSVSH